MTRETSVKIGYLKADNATSATKTIKVPTATASDEFLVAFANSLSAYLANPVTEAAKVATVPLTLS